MSDHLEIGLGYATLKQQAKQLIEKQDWVSAHNTLIKMQELSPNNYQLLIKQGNVYEKLGNFTAAEWYYKKAIKLNQSNDFGYCNLGKLYLSLNQYNLAQKALVTCLEIDDTKAVTNFYYGELLYCMDMISSSLYYYRKAADIKPLIANYQFLVGKTALILNTII